MIRRTLLIALLVALPLAAEPLPGARAWRVTLAEHVGSDSAAVARRLAAMYRGQLETAVDENGTFLVSLTDAAAALLAADGSVRSVQVEGQEAVSSPSAAVRMPAVVANGSTSWSLGMYSYDGAGNIKSIDTDTYVYDSSTRLLSGAASGKTEKYTYDEFGNILTIETSGSPKRLLGVNAASNRMDQTTALVDGQLVTFDHSAEYDAKGNVTAYLLDRFQYDSLNVLRKAHVAGKWRSYVYNASDERIAVIEQASELGTETRSDWTLRDASGQALRRLSREDGQWQWNQDYIYRNGQMLASEVAGPAKRYHYHLDHLGTPRLITGNGGVEISRHTYLPFGPEVGAIPAQNPPDGEWKKFTGHERDQGSIDYMHARYYNPYVGRFLSVDPGGVDLVRPQSWNRYAYVLNNPVNLTDPTGRCIWDICVGEAALLVAATALAATTTAYFNSPSVSQPGRTNAEAIASSIVDGVAAIGALISLSEGPNKTIDDVLSNVRWGPKTRGPSTIGDVPGGLEQALNDFGDVIVPGSDIDKGGGVIVGELPDGRTIIVRDHSSDGAPTLEIQDGDKRIKVRYRDGAPVEGQKPEQDGQQ